MYYFCIVIKTKAMRELFEKYKGQKAVSEDYEEGIICGYDEGLMLLVMAVTEGKGWIKAQRAETIIVTHEKNESGYLYVDEESISR